MRYLIFLLLSVPAWAGLTTQEITNVESRLTSGDVTVLSELVAAGEDPQAFDEILLASCDCIRDGGVIIYRSGQEYHPGIGWVKPGIRGGVKVNKQLPPRPYRGRRYLEQPNGTYYQPGIGWVKAGIPDRGLPKDYCRLAQDFAESIKIKDRVLLSLD